MRLTVRIPELPEGIEVDPIRLEKALRWALHEGWDPGAVWQVNNVPAIAQLEEMVYQDGQAGLAELFEAVTKQLGLPSNPDTLSLLAKAKLGRKPQLGQLGFSFDEEQHPREQSGGVDSKYKPGEFIPKDGPQTLDEEKDALVKWNRAIGTAQNLGFGHIGGERKLDLAQARGVLEQFQRDSARLESEASLNSEENGEFRRAVAGRGRRTEQELQQIVERLEDTENRRNKERADLTPEQRATLQVEGWTKLLQTSRQWLADHMSGEAPQTPEQLDRRAEEVSRESKYYEGELVPALRKPENGPWIDRLNLDQKVSALRRYGANTPDKILEEASRTKQLEALADKPGWNEMQESAEILSHRAGDVQMHYGWLAGQVETETEETALEEKGKRLAAVIQAKAKKLVAASKKEKARAAKFFKEEPKTGVGFTRQQRATEPEDNLRFSKWGWYDLIQPRGAPSKIMPQENWDEIQSKHPMEGMPSNFHYMGPTNMPQLQAEAQRAAARLKKRVPAWLMDRVADNGGEYVWAAAPPYRLGFKTQAEYDAWIEKQGGKSIKENDPRHWDDVGGFYRHADKKAYSQVGESGQRGTVDLELHEFGHMLDYLFHGGTSANRKVGAVSETPEFKSIWKNLHPWLDNYMTKDGDAAELFAEGFAVFSESGENRQRMLSKDVPEPMQRLGQFFERFLNEDSHAQVEKSLRLIIMKSTPDRHARGKVTENGEDLRWDDGHVDEEAQEERHEHFPTLFLKNPRKAEKDKDNG